MKPTFTGKLLDYKDFRQHSDTFCETGSAAGDGIQRALDAEYTIVMSCEGADEWFKMCVYRFIDNERVIMYQGKSTDCLGKMFHGINVPLVIFLDAHPAGPASFGHADWVSNPNGEANQHNIITAELKIVLAHRNDHVIIIDDVNGMADGCAEQYINQMLAANPEYKFSFYDENLSGDPAFYYHDKILVAIP